MLLMNVKLLNKIYLQLPFFGPLEIIFSFDGKRQIKGRLEEENKSCENKEKMVIGEKAKSSMTKKAEGIA